MNITKIDFSMLSWDEPTKGVRSKSIVRNGRKLRLVEFTKEFVEHDWCMKGHIGYVLEGDLEITFPGMTEKFVAGDGIFIAGGEDERHKAKVIGSVVRLILVEDDESHTHSSSTTLSHDD
jgi:quercetin dioxygenase-like cupin family protein